MYSRGGVVSILMICGDCTTGLTLDGAVRMTEKGPHTFRLSTYCISYLVCKGYPDLSDVVLGLAPCLNYDEFICR